MHAGLRNIERLHLAVLAAALAVAYCSGWLAPLSVLLGAVVMGVNFRLLSSLTARLVSPAATHNVGTVLALMLGKFVLFVGLLALLLWRAPIQPMSFAVGASLLLVAIILSILRAPTAAPAS